MILRSNCSTEICRSSRDQRRGRSAHETQNVLWTDWKRTHRGNYVEATEVGERLNIAEYQKFSPLRRYTAGSTFVELLQRSRLQTIELKKYAPLCSNKFRHEYAPGLLRRRRNYNECGCQRLKGHKVLSIINDLLGNIRRK